MSQLPRYESYKDSGVQWLGEIPSHWVLMSLKFSLDMPITDGPHETPEILTEGIPFISAEAVKNDKLDFNKKRGYISEEDDLRFSKKYKPKFGDVYMVKSGATTGNVAKVETHEHFNIWSPLAVMRPDLSKITTEYIFYTLKSDYFNHSVKTKWNMGTQQNIGMGVIANIPIIVPPVSEQKIIADFLDKRLAQVDALIAKQETLLEKLAEQRVALISHAVTKGLNPDVKLQKSDSEILGSYPENWKVKRLRFDIETNPSKSEIQLDGSELVSFIPMESVSVGGGLDLSNERMISEVSSGYTYFADGDVVVAKITPCFENGKASIAENLHQGIAFGTTELHVLRCKENLLNKFLFFIIQSDKFMKYGESEMYGAGGQKRVPERFIKDYLIALPSLIEQQQICDFIESQLSHLDGLVQKVESTIATFKEYRSTLITQVVTGKIDVRNLKVN